jgi:hypothetical protein
MFNYKKSQTATEYIIILAIVIIISLIVVSTLGGIPSMGASNKIRVSAAYWQNADIAITSYSMSASENHTLIIQNRLRNAIQIEEINLSLTGFGEPQTFYSGSAITLGPGQTRRVENTTAFPICSSSGDAFTSNVKILYVVTEIGSTYPFTGDGNKLEGKCAN